MAEYVHGIFNVEKCVKYLRGIGVEISAETEARRLDAQAAHRFLRSMKGVVAEGWDCHCKNGHVRFVQFKRRTPRKKRVRHEACDCGAPFVFFHARWYKLRDGSVRDYRPESERWKPLDWQEPDSIPRGPA